MGDKRRHLGRYKAAAGINAAAGIVACVSATFLFTSHAVAQTDLDEGWVEDLPRPGFEPRRIRTNGFIISPSFDFSAIADSNLLADDDVEDTDLQLLFEPALNITRRTSNLNFDTEIFAGARRHIDNVQENLETFGFDSSFRYNFNRKNSAVAEFGFQRSFERRDDPDAFDDQTVTPTLINIVNAGVGYDYRPGRFGASARLNVINANFLSVEDDDRDLTNTSATVRALAGISNKIDFFGEGFINWRTFRLDVDRTGVNRDARTAGFRTGVAFDITDKLEGEIGVGIFNVNFQDPSLDDFTGTAVSGSVRWLPRARTGVLLNVFRGDETTIRFGASGRIDTRARAEIIRELRHNVRGRASLGYRRRQFRTAGVQTETDVTARVGVEYLLNRHVALSADYDFTNRDATIVSDQFDRHRFGISLNLRY